MQDDTDAMGYKKRYAGDKLQFKSTGRKFTVIENQGLLVLCPCGDILLIHFDDKNETLIVENSLDIVEQEV